MNDIKVPVGTLNFVPNVDKGADGPSVLAKISQGSFETFEGKPLTPGENLVYLTVSAKWLKSGGTDVSPMEETSAITTLTQKFEVPSDGSELSFDFEVDFEQISGQIE